MSRALLWSTILVAAAANAATGQTTASHPDHPGSITVGRAWAGATPGPVKTGAVYLTVTDAGAPDRITGVSAPVAEGAGMHESSNDNGIMRMRPVQSLPVAPGKPVTFAPGGYHVMLTGLKHPLQPGETFPLTLTFERAAPVTVTVTVEKAGASAPSGHGAMHEGMDMGVGPATAPR
jgi:copper(I)-binding protein